MCFSSIATTFSIKTICCQSLRALAGGPASPPSPSPSQPPRGAQCSSHAASAYAAMSAAGRASQAGNLRGSVRPAPPAEAWLLLVWPSDLWVMCASRTIEPVASSVGMWAPLTGTSNNLPAGGASSRRSCAKYTAMSAWPRPDTKQSRQPCTPAAPPRLGETIRARAGAQGGWWCSAPCRAQRPSSPRRTRRPVVARRLACSAGTPASRAVRPART
jgi:hypothetical protein